MLKILGPYCHYLMEVKLSALKLTNNEGTSCQTEHPPPKKKKKLNSRYFRCAPSFVVAINSDDTS